MMCQFCGNKSGLKDSRGGCVSCGGFGEYGNDISTGQTMSERLGLGTLRSRNRKEYRKLKRSIQIKMKADGSTSVEAFRKLSSDMAGVEYVG